MSEPTVFVTKPGALTPADKREWIANNWAQCKTATRKYLFEYNREKYSSSRGHIYVISMLGTNYIKIGFSVSPQDRLRSLQTSSPFEMQLLYHEPGSLQFEQLVHERLKSHITRGDWYEMRGALKDYVEFAMANTFKQALLTL